METPQSSFRTKRKQRKQESTSEKKDANIEMRGYEKNEENEEYKKKI